MGTVPANPCEEKRAPRLRRRHATVRGAHGTLEADIDKAIAPLILELWKAGIATYLSCQSSPAPWVFIQFAYPDDLVCFLNIVGQFELGRRSLHRRMQRGNSLPEGKLPGRWWYRMVVLDLAAVHFEDDELDEDGLPGPPNWRVTYSLHFPRRDLPTVLRRIVAHNEESLSVPGVTGK